MLYSQAYIVRIPSSGVALDEEYIAWEMIKE